MSRPGPARARAEFEAFRVLRALSRTVPCSKRPALGARLFRGLLSSSPRLAARVEGNLRLVMPEVDAAERLRIKADMADNFGRTIVEIMNNPQFHESGMSLPPKPGPGVAAIDAAAAAGTGAILVTGHFGQWEAGRAWMRARGISCSGVYRALDNPYINDVYVRNLDFGGSPVFPKTGRGIRSMVGHVARGGIVAVLTDQYQHRAAPLDFLGQPAPTALLPAELALKFDLPLIPIYGIRQSDGAHVEVVVEPPLPRGTAAEMMQAANDSLAAQVRAHPGQYYWLHRRWTKELPTILSY